MNNENEFYVLCAGFLMGIAFSGLFYLYSDNTSFKIQRAKTECERSLPRDQQCYIMAVPPSKD